jgi:hypothetical protein
MIEVQHDGQRAIIDVREIVKKGQHPKGEIFKYIKEEAPIGTIIEIHVPHRAEPLVAGLKSFGLNVTINELAMDHFLIRTFKLSEI